MTKKHNKYIIKVSNDTLEVLRLSDNIYSRIETELEVKSYLQNLKYALNHGAKIEIQSKRLVDDIRDKRYTNAYTISALFPHENPTDALKRELLFLTEQDYIRTLKDIRFPKRSEMREFGKVYNKNEDVYIKIRVEILGIYGAPITFVMSFHFAERPLAPKLFPYRKN